MIRRIPSLLLCSAIFICTALGDSSAALAAVPSAAQNGAKFHVLIDPGHGGVDTGATRGTIRESRIALAVAKKLAELLRAHPSFTVSLTRESDVSLSLAERAAIARRVRADLFVSIHANASNDPRAHGVEFWFQNQIPADEESMFLASRENQTKDGETGRESDADETVSSKGDLARILDDLHRNYRIASSSELSKTLLSSWHNESRRRNKNAIRQAPFYVVSEVPVPSALVELGFVSHESEGPRMNEPEVQGQMARSLFDGLLKFKASVDSDHAKN